MASASAFELLEAYVLISERGAAQVEAALSRIEAAAARVASKPVEVTITATENAQAAADAVAGALVVATTAAADIEQKVAAVGTALATVATPAINTFRGALVPVSSAFEDVLDVEYEVIQAAQAMPAIGQSTALVATQAKQAAVSMVAMATQVQRLTVLQRIQGALGSWAGLINNARAAASGFFSRMESGLGTVQKLAITLGAAKLAMLGFNEAASEQSTFVAFRAILGDGEKAKQLLQDINAIAVDTPFPVAEIRKTVQQLLALGTAQSDVIEEFTMLANIAAGVGSPIENIARAYTQVRSKQQLYAEELQQLGDAGVPILQELAEMMHLTTRQVRELAQEGNLGFPELEAAFKRMTSEGGKFSGIIQDTTFIGQGGLNKLKDAAADVAIQLSQAFELGDAQDSMQGLVALVQSVADGIGKWNEGVSAFEQGIGRITGDDGFEFLNLFEAVGQALQLEEEMQRLSDNMARPLAGGQAEALAATAKGWKDAAAEADEYLKKAKEWNKDSNPMKIALESLSDPLLQMADNVRDSVLDPLEQLEAKLGDLRHLFARDLISEDVYTKAIKNALSETDKLLEQTEAVKRSLRTSFNVGTTQAFTFRIEASQNRDQLRKSEDQLRAAEIGNGYLKEISEKLEDIKFQPEVTQGTFDITDIF